MSLFLTTTSLDDRCHDKAYINLANQSTNQDKIIRDHLERLWCKYKPYADSNFRERFASKGEFHGRFWEMYLAVFLLNSGKKLRPRSEIEKLQRDRGPDICVYEGDRKVWIEAVCPTAGETPDRVPPPDSAGVSGMAQRLPDDQIILRITSCLRDKNKIFIEYSREGVIKEFDLSLVAISGARFYLPPHRNGFSIANRAVYEIGDACISFGQQSKHEELHYERRESIRKKNASCVTTDAFSNDEYAILSGLIWTTRNYGNFAEREHDISFVPNRVARRRLPENWAPWYRETRLERNSSGGWSLTP